MSIFYRINRLAVVGFAFIFIGFLTFVASYVSAQSRGPSAPPLQTSGDVVLPLIPDVFESLVHKTNNPTQVMQGPLSVSTSFSGWNHQSFFSYSSGNTTIGALGSTAVNALNFSPFFSGSTNVGIFGYAQSGPGLRGIYAGSQSGIGLMGIAASSANDAGRFFGKVLVDPADNAFATLTVSDTVFADHFNILGEITVSTSQAASSQYSGMRGTVIGLDSAGVYGASVTGAGISANVTNGARGAYAVAYAASAVPYGAYGYHSGAGGSGHGVTGSVSSAIASAFGVYGESVKTGVSGVVDDATAVTGTIQGGGAPVNNLPTGTGVFACGTEAAATFNNDVYIEDGLYLGLQAIQGRQLVESSGAIVGVLYNPRQALTRHDLADLLTACLDNEANCN